MYDMMYVEKPYAAIHSGQWWKWENETGASTSGSGHTGVVISGSLPNYIIECGPLLTKKIIVDFKRSGT